MMTRLTGGQGFPIVIKQFWTLRNPVALGARFLGRCGLSEALSLGYPFSLAGKEIAKESPKPKPGRRSPANAYRRQASRGSKWREGASGDGKEVSCPTPAALALVICKQGTSNPVIPAWCSPVAAAAH